MSLTFPTREEIARLSARMLLEIRAVDFNAAQPFTYASGLKGPTYVDCRRIISFPRVRATLMDFMAATVMRDAGFEAFDVVAGGETAGIPFAAWIAERLGLPMLYVRKKPKGFGRNAQIEGAQATAKSVRWYAHDMRKKGIEVPPRQKVHAAEMNEEESAEWLATVAVVEPAPTDEG